MRELSIVGGIYLERCIQPLWNAVYGSAGRAAQAVSALLDHPTKLYSYVADELLPEAQRLAIDCNAVLVPTSASQFVAFDYLHPLSRPAIRPPVGRIAQNQPIKVNGDVVLRYGMLEGEAILDCDTAVFDPQSAFEIPNFQDNGSQAKRLALVMNGREASIMSGLSNAEDAAERLIGTGAEVVVIKQGARGALIKTHEGSWQVPLYRTQQVWKIGSGDVFSATFAALWGCQGLDPVTAANLASKATSLYCDTRSLPTPTVDVLSAMARTPLTAGRGRIYLAGPFFDLAQRWLIEEARDLLRNMGAEVFSPVHEVGPGPAEIVAPEDTLGLEGSDVVFAVLNGLDPGTLFEVGYATKIGKPVIAFAQNVKDEDLKMVIGSRCEVTDDFVSAIYRTIWALPTK